MKKKKYKIWLHLEEITLDENEIAHDYRSLDDVYLPLPVSQEESLEDAIKCMEWLHDQYYEGCKCELH